MGPLAGLNVIEMAGIGPAPFVGMMLSDMGADVLRIDRKSVGPSDSFERVKAPNFIDRGRRSIALDLKHPEAAALTLDLIAGADAVIEGFRPGVMERLGLGPDVCLARRPSLVYGRVTGWGQSGPLSLTAGHDINYIALTGLLHAIGGAEAPVPPLNLIGDFAGGAMMLAFGVVCALLEAKTSGRGQVVDAAMTDGAATLGAMIFSFRAAGQWRDARASNLLDGGAPFYRAYVCADGKFVAVGALEPQFFAALLKGLGIAEGELPDRWQAQHWPAIAARFAAIFATKPRDAWSEVFAQTDACVTPVLSLDEAPAHPHNVARTAFRGREPGPAPRFSRTPGEIGGPPVVPGAGGEAALRDRGVNAERIAQLRACGALARDAGES
jgi:alpha-methylacyl-CoA racemase